MSNKEHPATQGFNTMWESVKHIGSKAIKWAAYGAVALALASFIIPVTPIITAIGGLLSYVGLGSGTSALVGTLVPIMTAGAVAGGIVGAAAGVGSLGGALEERRQDAVEDYERASVARQRAALMRGAGQGMGASVAPSAGMGRSRSQGMELG